MKFGIRDLLYATTFVAGLLALARVTYDAFMVVFVIANACLVVCPCVILFTTIGFADQRGQTLDVKTNPFFPVLKKIWILAAVCSVIVWIGIPFVV